MSEDPDPTLPSQAERLALLGSVLANVDAHIYLKDREGRYLYANEKVLELYGRTAAEVIGRKDRELLDSAVAERLMAIDKLVLDSMSRQACEELMIGLDGKTRHYWSTKLPLLREDKSPCLIGFSTEITELLRLRQSLERQRVTDPLTGLANRAQFEEELALAQWREEGLGSVPAAVNLSPSQLKSTSLLESVCESVTRHGIEPGELEMEVTESMMMDEPEQSIAVLNELRSEGVHISIDDFGTGYSSMAYLKRLPVGTLKLDRHFVTEIASDSRDADLCAGVIALAHKLGLKVVAEGVETEAQAKALAERDCDLFQGYLFSRPLPAAQITNYLRARQRD